MNQVSCILCRRSEETEVTGALSTKQEVTAHQNCLVSKESRFLRDFVCAQVESEVGVFSGVKFSSGESADETVYVNGRNTTQWRRSVS